MNSAKKIMLIFFITFMQSSWSSVRSVGAFNIEAGSKKLILQNNPNIEWRQFCFDTKMGCARFNFSNGKSEDVSGFIKVIADNLLEKDFNKYCKEVFDISSAHDKTLNSFSVDTSSKLQHCSWKGKQDITNFFWKDGMTILVNTSVAFNAKNIISEAKFNEKR